MKNYLNLYDRSDWQNGECPKCSDDKRCSQTTDGALAVCYKNFTDSLNVKEGLIGTYGTFIIDPEALRKRELQVQTDFTTNRSSKKLIKTIEPIDQQTRNLLNLVYSSLLSQWSLSTPHLEYLKNRGFTQDQIISGRYKTSSNQQHIINNLEAEFGSKLSQVPGFIQILGKYYLRTSNELIIPTTSHFGEIINFRIRNTSPNCPKNSRYSYLTSRSSNYSSGLKAYLAAHVVSPSEIKDSRIWITEGEFKAHVAAEKIGAKFISIPGVGMWSLALEAIDFFNPGEVVICFDSDLWEKKDVAKNLLKLTIALKEKNYEISFANW